MSGLSGSPSLYDGMLFSALGEDNDKMVGSECSTVGTGLGGFWFNACGGFRPNAIYYRTETNPSSSGILWKQATSSHLTIMKRTKMMVRRKTLSIGTPGTVSN